MASKKYVSLSKLSTFLDNLKNKFAELSHKHTISDLTDYTVDSALSSASNNPVQNKVIDAEFEAVSTAMNALDLAIDGKADASHSHNDLYYTESEIDAKLESKADSSHTHNNYVPTSRTINGKALTANISLSASDVGALSNTTDIPDALSDLTSDSTHRTVTDEEKATWNAKSDFSGSYNDLTNKPTIPSISGLATETYVNDVASNKVDKVSGKGLSTNDYTTTEKNKLSGIASGAEVNQNAFSNVVVGSTTIAADSKTDSLTIAAGTGISVVGDATNDKVTITNSGVRSIETGSSNGTISVNTNGTAANVAVKGLGSAAYTASTAYDAAGTAQTKADAALASAKSYADGIKNDLLNGAGGAYDTLKELGDLIDDNTDAISALESVAAGKADKTHSHAIADVSGLQSALDGKAAASHGTHVSYSTTAPVMDGTASAGSASTVARSDHKHPTDTSRASKTEFDTHTSNTTVHITSTERTNWNAAKTHADSAHAPSDAEKNQNAFSNVKIGSTTIAADTATDTLTLVAGTNVTITPDATNDKITISATDTNTTYSAGTGISLSGTTFSNSGVRSVSTGSSNGTISVNTNGTSADVAVKGLGSAAYTASTAYDAAGSANTALTNAKTYTDTVAEGKANKSQAVFYIEGGGTTDTTNKVATWTGSHSDISEYYAGLMIAYKISTAGSTTTTLNINNLGAVAVVKNATSAISTSFAVNSVILLVYTVDGTTAYWKAHDYDANTRNTVGDYRKNGTKLYFVGTTSSDASSSSSYATSYTNSNIYVTTENVLYSASGFQGKLVGNADTATSATSATKATQDASGNVIASTYETKTDASSKLAEAKTYTDTVAEGKANTSHTHTIANVANLQSSLDAKQATITGGATTIASSNLTANRALISNGSGKVAVSAVTSTELGYLDGVTSAIQTQLDSKAASSALSSYYTKTEIDNMEFITVNDIDTICGSTT